MPQFNHKGNPEKMVSTCKPAVGLGNHTTLASYDLDRLYMPTDLRGHGPREQPRRRGSYWGEKVCFYDDWGD